MRSLVTTLRRSRALPSALLAPVLVLVAAAVLLPAATGPAHAAHPHYLRLLRQGTFALERGEDATAVRDLRLACFGFLDEPPLLAQCLVRLGLAQANAGDDEGFRETFRRVVEVEERFGAYAAADVTPEERADFESEIAARIPQRTLEYSSVFKRLAETPEPAAGSGAEATPQQAKPETSPKASPTTRPTTSPAPGGTRAQTRGSGRQTATDPGTAGRRQTAPPGDDPAARPPSATGATLSPSDRDALDRARSLLAAATRRSDLDEPLALARRVADANPGSQEAQHLAAVIAYRASRWREAVYYFRRGGDPGEDDAEALFYYAVSLYESGDTDGAADAMRRSLPHLEATPFVQRYRDRILGPGDDGR